MKKRLGQEIEIKNCEGFNVTIGTMERKNPLVLYITAKLWLKDTNITSNMLHHIKTRLDYRINELIKPNGFSEKYMCFVEASLGDASKFKRSLNIELFFKQKNDILKPIEEFTSIFSDFFSTFSKNILSKIIN